MQRLLETFFNTLHYVVIFEEYTFFSHDAPAFEEIYIYIHSNVLYRKLVAEVKKKKKKKEKEIK